MMYGEVFEQGNGQAGARVHAGDTRKAAMLIGALYRAHVRELRAVAADMVQRPNRSAAGRQALALLRDEGGPDLLVDVVEFAVEAPGKRTTPHSSIESARWTQEQMGGRLVSRLNCGPWRPLSDDEVAAHRAKSRES